jgi:hypothetical protein
LQNLSADKFGYMCSINARPWTQSCRVYSNLKCHITVSIKMLLWWWFTCPWWLLCKIKTVVIVLLCHANHNFWQNQQFHCNSTEIRNLVLHWHRTIFLFVIYHQAAKTHCWTIHCSPYFLQP